MTRARDVANLIGSGNYSSTTFTATAGQTAFTISHTQGFVQVFMNGLLLDETVDYTSNGSAVTLTSGAAAGDEIEVVAYNTFSVGDALNQAAADTRYVNASGDTMTGALTVGGGVTVNNGHVNIDSGLSYQWGNSHERIEQSDGKIEFFTNNGEQMTLSGSSLGIGTTAPSLPLHIKGSTNTNAILGVESANWTTGATAELRLAYTAGYNRSIKGHHDNGLQFFTNPTNPSLQIDNSGIITKAYQPSFAVHTVPGNFAAGQVVNWQTEEYDRGNNFNMSNNRFTAPVAGFYHFSLVVFTNRTTSTGDVYWDLRKNGSLVWRNYIGKDGGSNVHVQAQGSTQIYLAASDYIDVYFASSIQTMDNSGVHNRFSGYLIG